MRTLKGAATSGLSASGSGPGFTLIEMLAVLVIAGVLIGLAIPAVTKLMSSGGVSAASREVANTLGLARQCAITQRVYARVVFPYSQTQTHPDMWYRTYAVMTNRDNSSTASTGWAYMTKWEYLPLGAVFIDNNALPMGSPQLAAGKGALDDANSLRSQVLPFPIPGFPSLTEPLAYIEFGPTGASTALGTGNGSTLAITEGITTVDLAANASTLTMTSAKTNTAPNVLLPANMTTISVDPLVGRIQVTR
jgi:prepilin-type N-terminal cleavage/methylation domain-containing protein